MPAAACSATISRMVSRHFTGRPPATAAMLSDFAVVILQVSYNSPRWCRRHRHLAVDMIFSYMRAGSWLEDFVVAAKIDRHARPGRSPRAASTASLSRAQQVSTPRRQMPRDGRRFIMAGTGQRSPRTVTASSGGAEIIRRFHSLALSRAPAHARRHTSAEERAGSFFRGVRARSRFRRWFSFPLAGGAFVEICDGGAASGRATHTKNMSMQNTAE